MASAFSRHAKLEWAVSAGLFLAADLCTLAVKRGQLLQLSWLRSRGYPWNKYTCSEAAGGGLLAVLQRARASGCPWDKRMARMSPAAARQRLPVG